MPTTNWLPRAAKTTEVLTGAITADDAATTYTLTRNGKTVSVVGQGSVSLTAAALVAAWNASTELDLSEQTAANPSSGTITLTMDTAGVPSGTTTLTVSGGTGTRTALSATTAATGPTFADDANNWSGAAVPTTEDVQIDLSRGSILYGLGFAAGTLNSLYIFSPSPTQNTIGLPDVNAAGYLEDRTKAATKPATATKIECESPFIRWNYGATANNTEVRKANGLSQGTPAVLLSGTSTSNVCEILSGSVGLAFFPDESYAAANVRVSENATVIQGPNGGTITTITSIGTLELNGTFGTLNQFGGSSIIEGTATPTLVYVRNSECNYRAGDATAFKVGNGAINCNNDLTPFTITTLTLEPGGRLPDKFQRATITTLVRGTGVEEISAA